MKKAPLLSVENLTVSVRSSAGWTPIVRDLSIEVAPGETLCLVGESGCGKSVTALAVMGLLPRGARIDAGRILLDGRDIANLDEPALRDLRGRDIAMIFQEPMTSLNPVLTIGEQVGEALIRHEGLSGRAARQRTFDLFERVRLPDAARRISAYPHQLSGGMRQRVMIAMALACKPKLLIADEPTTALDVTIQAQILALMAEIRAELGTAIIFITHDLGVVAEVADRVAVLYAGKVVEETDVFSLFDNARHPYTRGLMRSTPRLTAGQARDASFRLTEIRGTVPPPTDLPEGCAFQPRCERASDRCGLDPILAAGLDGRHVACWHPQENAHDDTLGLASSERAAS
ncbi:ABC transporter ATP-binding protein [Phreatobacter stygius]|uniref:ABC transporter ATP-binding protein n=1 Tax=Phreatobacter stygius TaxID=1940610 RepID=A0A4D7B8J0_9HYPH|nr:ABC transporter ATP-binding protein [Phreatobacter stygius]QCI65896.1 ABC transporter ATP-binding protein [Phreatobacter stygius]